MNKSLPLNRELPVDRRLLGFINEIVVREEVDLIVCSERKGTAVLRALIQEIHPPRFEWSWKKVVSTAAIEEFDWSSFEGKRVLIFDELVHHGHSLERAKRKLSRYLKQGIEVKTAGFAVWDRCVHHPDFSYYSSVGLEQYVEIRNEIITMLQRYGSLLLDTEHLEITARIECGLKEFYHELARASEDGNTLSFLSASERLNLTIWKPDIIEPDELKKWLTPGSNTTGVVAKCRVLERDHNHFSIMPILYPNTRCVLDDDWISRLPTFINRESVIGARPTYLFYVVGLLASIEVLKGIVSALGDLIRAQKIVLEVPRDDFSHLRAMFPVIDTDLLWEYVKNVVAESKLHKAERSGRTIGVTNVPQKALLNMSYFLITHLVEQVDRQGTDDEGTLGVSWSDLDRIATSGEQLIEANHKAWCVVPDRLIDSGLMHTDVKEVTSSNGERWAIRTFRPDSEVVAEKLRRHMSVRGNKWLPAT